MRNPCQSRDFAEPKVSTVENAGLTSAIVLHRIPAHTLRRFFVVTRTHMLVCVSLALLLSVSTVRLNAQNSLTFTTIDVPGATETDCNAINKFGAIVGTYFDSSGAAHGFIRSNGRFQFLNVSSATSTFAYGINDSNQVVGWYTDTLGITHGYMWNGHFTTIDYPLASTTNAWTITNAGTIVGAYVDANGTF